MVHILSSRKEVICINVLSPEYPDLKHRVPQDSILGAMIFSVYVMPIDDIIRKHKLIFHICAYDKQLYIIFRATPAMAAITRKTGSGVNLVCIELSQ